MVNLCNQLFSQDERVKHIKKINSAQIKVISPRVKILTKNCTIGVSKF